MKLTLTLRQARKLETKIAHYTINNVLTIKLDPYDSRPAEPLIAGARNIAQQKITTGLQLINTRATIRRLIQEINEKAGINTLISERKRMKDHITLLEEVRYQSKVYSPKTVEAVENRLHAIRNAENSGHLNDRAVHIPALETSTLEEVEKNIRTTKAAIEEIDEQLLSKNTGTRIELSESDVEILQAAEII